MQLLISDANILIDFEEGQLLKEIFQLSYQFAIPDILYHEELASEHGQLLTGDKDLRSAAEKEGTIVYGTIWLVEEMITQKIINTKTAKEAYKQMKTQGRRLPWDTAMRRLQES